MSDTEGKGRLHIFNSMEGYLFILAIEIIFVIPGQVGIRIEDCWLFLGRRDSMQIVAWKP